MSIPKNSQGTPPNLCSPPESVEGPCTDPDGAIGAGNKSTTTQLLSTPHHRDLLRYFTNRVRNAEDAKDLTQQVHVRLLASRLPPVECPRAYIFRTASNVLKDHTRKRDADVVDYDSTQVEQAADRGPDYWQDPLYELVEAEQTAQAAMSTLPETVGNVVKRDCIDGQSVSEIAAELELSENTVAKYRSVGKRTLKALKDI